MFIKAIEKVAQFTRPIHTILLYHKGKQVIPGTGTLFFVNEDGYAITCKHIAELIVKAETINSQNRHFREERNKLPNDSKLKKSLLGLEMKYKYKEESIAQFKINFRDCVDKMSGFTTHLHPKYDLAIVKFEGYGKLHYQAYAKFKKNGAEIVQGKFLCRLGFPFPEFTNFRYNENSGEIEWTNEGISNSPRFPIEGMITRFLAEESKIFGIELSTPGLRGQSGGPLFDENGIVYGMQFSTKHLHLGFDMVEKEIQINNKTKKVTDYSFLHLGQCVHANIIKEFLTEKNVRFYEE